MVKYNWSEKTAFIVEDESINYQLLKAFLKKTNISIVYTDKGSEVMDILENNHVDIILLDVQLPDINGMQLTEIIKSQHDEIPIIVQTASILESQIEEMLELGCDDYVLKPINREMLLRKIDRLML